MNTLQQQERRWSARIAAELPGIREELSAAGRASADFADDVDFADAVDFVDDVDFAADVDFADDVTAALTAFGVLLLTYTHETRFSASLSVGNRPAQAVEIAVSDSANLAEVSASIRAQIASLDLRGTAADEATMAWSELSGARTSSSPDGALLSLRVQLSNLSLRLEECAHRGLIEAVRPLEHIERHWRSALWAQFGATARDVSDVRVLGPPERRLLLDVLSRSDLRPDFSAPGLLHHVFEASARARPDEVAVVFGDAHLTYGELNARAERLARGLRARGIGPGAFVAFRLPRSFDVYVALLGVLKSGAAYVPLDPEYPLDRVRYILSDCGAAACLTVKALAPPDSPCRVILLDQDWNEALPDVEPSVAPRAPASSDICYVIYTSGSTGKPKGVAIEHRSAVNLVRVEQDLFGTVPDDRVFQGFSIAFDAAVEEVWLAFAAGATLVVGTKDVILSDLARYLTDAGVTVFSTVPTLLSSLDVDLPTVRILILGGEACPQALAARWSTPERAMYNTYGPTEATVIATCAQLFPDRPVTIGRPIANYFAYVLDPSGKLAPVGVSGELCIGGVGVARGYVGRPELTAAKFVPNPFAQNPPLLYKTGDRARFDRHGNIEFLGRLDDQVKLRGFRIELGEIEAALMGCSGVSQALALVVPDVTGDKQLVAYVVARDRDGISESDLKERLRTHLPPYMVPAFIEILESLPTLTSGKVDKKSLPPPGRRREIENDPGASPADALEAKIARCWAALFGVSTVSRDADFFLQLGGHSLLVAQMVSTLRKEPELASLSVLDVYEHPTVAALARHYRRAPDSEALESPVAADSAPERARASSTFAYCVCGAVQLVGLYLLFGIYAVQLEAPYLTFGWLRHMDASVAVSVIATAIVAFATGPIMFLLAALLKWLVIGRYKEGRYPLWGAYYLRWWFIDRLFSIVPTAALAGTPLINAYYRLLGARVGANVFIGSDSLGAFDMVRIGDDSTIGVDANLSGHTIEDGMLVLGPISIGNRCLVGARSVLTDGVEMNDGSALGELSMLPRGAAVPSGEQWNGSPARNAGMVDPAAPFIRPRGLLRAFFTCLYTLAVLTFPAFVIVAILPGLVGLNYLYRHWDGEYAYLQLAPVVAVAFVLLLCVEIVAAKWLVLGKARPGRYEVFSGFYFRKWFFDQLMGLSLNLTGALYATSFLPSWYRLLGVKLGRNCEVSTASGFVPDLLHVGDGAFVADCVSMGAPHIDRGFVYAAQTRIGERSFIGNSAIVSAGTVVGSDCLVGCLSVCPADPTVSTKASSSWFGSPSIALPRREEPTAFSSDRTYLPSLRLVAQRLAIELVRVALPTTGFVISTCVLITTCLQLSDRFSMRSVVAIFPLLYAAFGATASLVVIALKWILVGRYRPGEKPLWHHFVWRSELVTGLHENLANPFFVERLVGTPFAAWFFRALGMKIGRRVFLATTEFTEYDLLSIGDDVCLNNDCTLQTHLFEDRVMKMSTIRIGNRCTVGEDAVVLYDTFMEEESKLGALSLLMKGETLPAASRWEGSPATALRPRLEAVLGRGGDR